MLTLVPAGTGATAIVQIMYAVSESAGGTAAGVTTCAVSATVNLYTDGADTFTLAVAADGAITVSRTAGTSLFDARIHLLWV